MIGGGIAGLVAALDLARAGPAAGRAGGRRPRSAEWCRAHRVGGLTLDAGAESFATARPAVTDLIAELGLADGSSLPNPVGAWVRHRAGSAPLPATGFLGIPGRPWAADVRRVIGLPGVAALRGWTPCCRPGPGCRTGRRLGGVVRSRMGRRVLDRLVEPVAGGVYAADPDTLEVAHRRTRPVRGAGAGRVAGRRRPAAARRRGALRVRGGHPRPAGCTPCVDPAGRRHRRGRRRRCGPARRVTAADAATATGWRVETGRRCSRSAPSGSCWPCPPARPPACWNRPIPGVARAGAARPDHPGADLHAGARRPPAGRAPRAAPGCWCPPTPPACGPRHSPTRPRNGLARRRWPDRAGTCCGCPTGGATADLPTRPTCPASRWPTPRNCSGVAAVARGRRRRRGGAAGRRRCPRRGPDTPTRCARCARGSAAPGWRVVGAAVAGSGLAAVVGDARREAAALIERLGDVASIASGIDPAAPRTRPRGEGGWTDRDARDYRPHFRQTPASSPPTPATRRRPRRPARGPADRAGDQRADRLHRVRGVLAGRRPGRARRQGHRRAGRPGRATSPSRASRCAASTTSPRCAPTPT